MRITTQMLNQAAQKAGLPINRHSLLDYVNNTGSGDNSLLNALKSKNSQTAGVREKAKYEKLEKAAESLSAAADKFTVKGEDSILEKAESTGDKTELFQEVSDLISEYNSTMSILQSASGTMNDFYRQSLKDLVTDNKETLGNIGITLSKDGRLSVDEEKLKAADKESIERALGNSGSFTSKLSFLAGRVSDNAAANVKSVSNSYSSTGSEVSAYRNKYDFWS